MTVFLTVLHIVVCVLLVGVVLLQRGKGAEIGAVFGGGASTTVFGSRGAGNFLTRLTTGAAIVFMLTSLTLAYTTSQRAGERLFDEEEGVPPAAGQPAAPAEPGAAPEGESGAASGAEAGATAGSGEASPGVEGEPGASAQPAEPGAAAGSAESAGSGESGSGQAPAEPSPSP